MEQALADVRVLELGQYIAGPYCSKMLADYGAQVIKVERPGTGDPARRMGPFPADVPHREKSGLFAYLNANKRGVTLNLRSSSGRKILLELVRSVDIIIENFRPHVMPSLGLSYEVLAQTNPRLVMVSISNFGQTGPYRDYRATELAAFATTTRMYMHGRAEREPLRYGPDISQFQAGITAAAAAMSALFAARWNNTGQQVDISIMECLMGNVDARTLWYSYSGVKSPRRATGGPGGGVYPCQDGYILFAASGDRFFRRLCRAMGRTDLLTDPRFASVDTRMQHQNEFDDIFLPWLLEHTRWEVFHTCQPYGVMCAPVLTMDELFSDPQNLTRGFFVETEHPVLGHLTLPGAPFKSSEAPWQWRQPAPLLGQHNDEVYRQEMGYGRQELIQLRAAGVI